MLQGGNVFPVVLRGRVALNLVVIGLGEAIASSECEQVVSNARQGNSRARVVHVGTWFPLVGGRVVALHAGVVCLSIVAAGDVDLSFQYCGTSSRAGGVHISDGGPPVS